jgi:hypothetical protein
VGSPTAKRAPTGPFVDKLWRDAVRKKAAEYAEGKAGPKKLDKVAEALFDAAMAGDVSAAKEIGDRMDGKVAQAIVGGSEEDDPIRLITRIERVIVRPQN